ADRLFPTFRHYHLVLMDMFYDHLLAKNWSRYSDVPLEVYAENFYQLLEDNIAVLPDKTLRMLPHLRRENWLLQYATLEGLAFILFQMNYRIRHKVDLVSGIDIFKQYETEYETEFEAFFVEVQAFVHKKIISI
ncbi:MAG: acyl carrier protein phosphodiesterase, partial [Flavobacteriaceae bacterium]|nr:acyl carrier protein phosphodiesterase [Flavobacteriaceae bacterium]